MSERCPAKERRTHTRCRRRLGHSGDHRSWGVANGGGADHDLRWGDRPCYRLNAVPGQPCWGNESKVDPAHSDDYACEGHWEWYWRDMYTGLTP